MKLRSKALSNKFKIKDTGIDIPGKERFQNTKLPLLKEAVGLVFELKDSKNITCDEACAEVAKFLIDHREQRLYNNIQIWEQEHHQP